MFAVWHLDSKALHMTVQFDTRQLQKSVCNFSQLQLQTVEMQR